MVLGVSEMGKATAMVKPSGQVFRLQVERIHASTLCIIRSVEHELLGHTAASSPWNDINATNPVSQGGKLSHLMQLELCGTRSLAVHKRQIGGRKRLTTKAFRELEMLGLKQYPILAAPSVVVPPGDDGEHRWGICEGHNFHRHRKLHLGPNDIARAASL